MRGRLVVVHLEFPPELQRQKGMLSLEPCGDRTSPPEPGQGRPLFGVFQGEHTLLTLWAYFFKMSHYRQFVIAAALVHFTDGRAAGLSVLTKNGTVSPMRRPALLFGS